jgi:hypothetical protein
MLISLLWGPKRRSHRPLQTLFGQFHKVNSQKLNFRFTKFFEVRSKGRSTPGHRFGRLRGDYGVCVPMHDLPHTLRV